MAKDSFQKTFRLLDLPPMSGADNMALDETLLETRASKDSPDTLRFLQFTPPVVLVGYHQSVSEEVRTDYCVANGIDINRRITGGGAILFDESQLGWEVICEKSFFNTSIITTRLFEKLCTPVVQTLSQFGLNAAFRGKNDIEINGKKISGTGGTELYDAFFFQGTLLVDFDVDTMLKSLKIPVEKLKAKEINSIKERVTCLKWELGNVPSLAKIKKTICGRFEQIFSVRLVPSGLTSREQEVFNRKKRKFRSPEWVHLIQPRIAKNDTIVASYKSDAGLIRYTLSVNLSAKRLKAIYITGDFLSFPSRAVYDIEASLRGAVLDQDIIRQVIGSYFNKKKINIPGMSYDDFIKPLDQVFERIAIAHSGIPLDYCNKISVTNGSFFDIISKKPSVLLLPYCSKNIDCDLRYKKGCKQCGKCTIGTAWKMGQKYHLKPVSVTSFEDLFTELGKIERNKDSAFVGCCCQPFFTKHVDDFKKADIPGILVDIDNTTCYELDQAKEAYAGNYDKQTHLNIDLLETVLKATHENARM